MPARGNQVGGVLLGRNRELEGVRRRPGAPGLPAARRHHEAPRVGRPCRPLTGQFLAGGAFVGLELSQGHWWYEVEAVNLAMRVRDRGTYVSSPVFEQQDVIDVGPRPEHVGPFNPEGDYGLHLLLGERAEALVVVGREENDLRAPIGQRRPAVLEPTHGVRLRSLQPAWAERAVRRRDRAREVGPALPGADHQDRGTCERVEAQGRSLRRARAVVIAVRALGATV